MLNPIRWEGRHQVALILAATIGAVIGIALWYLGVTIGTPGIRTVQSPFTPPWTFLFWYDGKWWLAGGAVIGALTLYVARLNSD